MTFLFDQFDFTTIVFRSYQFIKKQLIIYLQDESNKIAKT